MNNQRSFLKNIERLLRKHCSRRIRLQISADRISSEPPLIQGIDGTYWDISISKRYKNDPYSLIVILLILSKIRPFWYELFLDFVANQCYRYRYQGRWMQLHQLAKLQRYELICYRITEEFSERDFFGNFKPILVEVVRDQFPVSFILKRKPKCRKPQRKRGYDDKGSMRLEHEIHTAVSPSKGPNPYRIDLRSSYRKKSTILNFLYG